jgi:hypothetical protein
MLGPAPCRRRTLRAGHSEAEHDGTGSNVVAVVQTNRNQDPHTSDERSVFAPEILQKRFAARNRDACVAPRYCRRIDANAVVVASQDVVTRLKWDPPPIFQQPAETRELHRRCRASGRFFSAERITEPMCGANEP